MNCYKHNATYNILSEIQVTTDPVNYNRPNKTKQTHWTAPADPVKLVPRDPMKSAAKDPMELATTDTELQQMHKSSETYTNTLSDTSTTTGPVSYNRPDELQQQQITRTNSADWQGQWNFQQRIWHDWHCDVPAAVKFQLTHTVPMVTLQFIDQTTTVVSTSSDHTVPPTTFSKLHKLLSTNTFFQSTLLGLLASWRSTCTHAHTGTRDRQTHTQAHGTDGHTQRCANMR